jgi:hypothetical protein
VSAELYRRCDPGGRTTVRHHGAEQRLVDAGTPVAATGVHSLISSNFTFALDDTADRSPMSSPKPNMSPAKFSKAARKGFR